MRLPDDFWLTRYDAVAELYVDVHHAAAALLQALDDAEHAPTPLSTAHAQLMRQALRRVLTRDLWETDPALAHAVEEA